MQKIYQLQGVEYSISRTEGEGFEGFPVDQFLRQFNEIFSANADRSWFEWKYLKGRAISYQLRSPHDQCIVANWSAFPRALRIDGKTILAAQNGDVFVAPEFRGILTKRGPLHAVSGEFLSQEVGEGKRFSVAYGFPNVRHMRVLEKYGFFRKLYELSDLAWTGTELSKPLGGKLTRLDSITQSKHFDRALAAFDASLENHAIFVRTPEYYRWRFERCPAQTYLFFELQFPMTKTRSFAVCREEGARMRVVDLIGPIDYAQKSLRLLGATSAQEFDALTMWAAPGMQDYLPRCREVSSSGAEFAYATASAIPVEVAANCKWWSTCGDTDFI